MNRKLLTPTAIFVALNFITNLFFFFVDPKLDKIQPMLWISCIIFTYLIFFFSRPNMKINWVIYTVYYGFIAYCLNETTFKNFISSNYNFDHIFSSLNKNVQMFIVNQTSGSLTNFNDFAININIFSLGVILFSILYLFLFKNKYISQIICDNLFLCILISLSITTLIPVKTTSDVYESIGRGDLAQLNDKISVLTHYLYFSTISLQITLFTFLTLFLVKENWFIGGTLFIILILLSFSHITLNYSKFSEVIFSVFVAFSIYFINVQHQLKQYNQSITFFK